jgi:hypothetical protein
LNVLKHPTTKQNTHQNEIRSNLMLRRPGRLSHQLGPIASRGRQEENGQECRFVGSSAQESLPQAARILPIAAADPGRH